MSAIAIEVAKWQAAGERAREERLKREREQAERPRLEDLRGESLRPCSCSCAHGHPPDMSRLTDGLASPAAGSLAAAAPPCQPGRSEERRVGEECVSRCGTWGAQVS